MTLILILTLSLYFNLTPPELDRPSGGEFTTNKIHRIVSMSVIDDELQEPAPMQIELQQLVVIDINIPEPFHHEPVEDIDCYHDNDFIVDHGYFTLVKAITHDEYFPTV